MVRLFGLLGLLGLGFLGVTLVPAAEHGDARPLALAATPEAVLIEDPALVSVPLAADEAAETSNQNPALRHLPPAVRRLADAPLLSGPVVFGEAQPIPISAPVEAAVSTALREALPEGYLRIKATRANVRGGPSTNYDVVGRLAAGEEVEVIEDSGTGWMLIRLEGDGVEGWIAASLLER